MNFSERQHIDDHFGLGMTKNNPILTQICAKNIFTFSFHVTLTFYLILHVPLCIITVVHRYVFTKFEGSTVFLIRENMRHVTDYGWTDRQTDRRGRGATLNAVP